MRILEFALLIALLLVLIVRLLRSQRPKTWARQTVYLPVVLLVLQMFVEGYRWQLLPAYVVTVILLAVQLVNIIRKVDFRMPLSRVQTILRVSVIVMGVALVVSAGYLAVALPVFILPDITGAYSVGTTPMHLVDYGRLDEHASQKGTYREIGVRLWYPAGDSGAPDMPYMNRSEARALAGFYGLPTFFFDHVSLVHSHSRLDVPPVQDAFPLVLFSPSGYVSQSTAMCEELASHGYVVASINHPYWNAYTFDSAGVVTMSDRHNPYFLQMWSEESSSETEEIKDQITRSDDLQRKRDLSSRLNLAMPTEVSDVREWSHDISYVLDVLLSGEGSSRSIGNIIDSGRIGVIGFSKGGAAAGQVCIDDSRISAGINLDGFMFGDIVDGSIPCPFMFVHSEPFLPDTYINDMFFANAPDESAMLKIRGAKHANFCDLSLFGSLITSQESFGAIDGLRVTELVNDYALAFLNLCLKGSYESLLACPAGENPEVEVKRKVKGVDIEVRPLSGPYLGQKPPGSTPQIFGAGILPVEGIQHCFPSFSPDGKEVYWMTVKFEDDRARGQIWFMKETDRVWKKPQIAPFSGTYNDHAPFVTADGNRIYFASSRPGGHGSAKNIWYVDRTEVGWSEPQNLGSPPNTDIGATQATFTNDGTVYFVGNKEGTQWNTGIYRSGFENGTYQELEPLPPPIATEFADVYPFIAPDESYLLFGSSRPGGRSTETDLYVSFRNSDDTWNKPVQLAESINNGKTVSFASVTHDGKYLFFNRFDEDGTDKFYWADVSILKKRRSQLTAVPDQDGER